MSGLVGGRAGPGASQCQGRQRGRCALRPADAGEGVDVDDDGRALAVQQVDTVDIQAEDLSRVEGEPGPGLRQVTDQWRGLRTVRRGAHRCGAHPREHLPRDHPQLVVPTAVRDELLQDDGLVGPLGGKVPELGRTVHAGDQSARRLWRLLTMSG